MPRSPLFNDEKADWNGAYELVWTSLTNGEQRVSTTISASSESKTGTGYGRLGNLLPVSSRLAIDAGIGVSNLLSLWKDERVGSIKAKEKTALCNVAWRSN